MDEHQETKHQTQKGMYAAWVRLYEDQGQVKGFSGNKNAIREARDWLVRPERMITDIGNILCLDCGGGDISGYIFVKTHWIVYLNGCTVLNVNYYLNKII